MNTVGVPAIDRMSQVINNAPKVQQSITGIVSFDEILHREIKKIKEREQKKEQDKTANEKLDFNPNEIQTLVYRNREEDSER